MAAEENLGFCALCVYVGLQVNLYPNMLVWHTHTHMRAAFRALLRSLFKHAERTPAPFPLHVLSTFVHHSAYTAKTNEKRN